MLRKFLMITLIISLVLPGLAFANPNAEMTITEKSAAIEKILYGSEQTGALIERVNKVEKDLFGTTTQDSLTGKLDRAYTYATVNVSGAPSLITKLNTVEWTLNHYVDANQPAVARLETVEKSLTGKPLSGAIDERLNKVMKVALANGWPEVADSIIAKDTLIKIKLVSGLHTKTTKVGDAVSFQAAGDVTQEGVLLIPSGAHGYGRVTKVEQRKNFGRDAKMEVAFETMTGVDGTIIATEMGEKAKEETKSLTKAAGATVAGLALLGPIGVVGGAFVQGEDISIPAGSELYIQVKTDMSLSGIKVN